MFLDLFESPIISGYSRVLMNCLNGKLPRAVLSASCPFLECLSACILDTGRSPKLSGLLVPKGHMISHCLLPMGPWTCGYSLPSPVTPFPLSSEASLNQNSLLPQTRVTPLRRAVLFSLKWGGWNHLVVRQRQRLPARFSIVIVTTLGAMMPMMFEPACGQLAGTLESITS